MEARLDRLESLDAIRQLPHRYALAVDTRDIDALVALFVEDVQVGRGETGRAALHAWFTESLGRIGASIHLVGNHVIDFRDADHATGVVTCRDEVDRRSDWGVGAVQYWDDYERRDGRWYFSRRRFNRWYMVDALRRPGHGAGVGEDGLATGQMPDVWPSWSHFWESLAKQAR